MNARQIANRLIEVHRDHGWRADREIRLFPRRIDVLAISLGATEVIAFEVKISVSDFRHDLSVPAKRKTVASHCTQFYYVAPFGLIDPEEVPDDCGLICYCDPCIGEPEPYFYVSRGILNRTSLLLDIQEVRRGRLRRDRLLDEFHEIENANWEDGYNPDLEIPQWMFPVTVRPFKFQFDPILVAETLASSPTPPFEIDEVPF